MMFLCLIIRKKEKRELTFLHSKNKLRAERPLSSIEIFIESSCSVRLQQDTRAIALYCTWENHIL